jgi:hypothetical protein
MKNNSSNQATHRVAKPFGLAAIAFGPGIELDLSEGILRLPPSAIQRLIDSGLLISLDPVSEAKRKIANDAFQDIQKGEVDMRSEIGKINAQLSTDVQELHIEYPDFAGNLEYIAKRHALEAAARTKIDKLQANHKAATQSSNAEVAKQQAALK